MTPPAVVRAVLFDVGGVLVEFTGPSRLGHWLGGRLPLEQMWPMWLASPAVRAFERGHIDPDTFASRLIDDLKLSIDRRVFLDNFAAWPRAVFPGAIDLVRRVRPGCVRATLSNTNVLHWPRLTDEMGLGALFERHFASHLVGKLKPDAEVFAHVVEALACEPAEILFLDDQPLNVEAGRASGLQAIRVDGVAQAESVPAARGLLRASAGRTA
jgi:putative hydrolase of the HAD superfamily